MQANDPLLFVKLRDDRINVYNFIEKYHKEPVMSKENDRIAGEIVSHSKVIFNLPLNGRKQIIMFLFT